MNVLIYDGPGTSARSRHGALSSLRALLSPFYSVRYISPAALIAEPWTSTTALLVIPGGRDLPYCRDLDGAGTRKIDDYVRRGGKYLGLCAGAYFASKNVEFELGTDIAVQGTRELALWTGISRGCAFPGFVYDSEDGARMAKVKLGTGDATVSAAMESLRIDAAIDAPRDTLQIYWNGGGVFVDGTEKRGVTVLAEYQDDLKVEGATSAVISLTYGNGAAVLSGVHPEIMPAVATKHASSPPSATPTEIVALSKSLDPAAMPFVPSSQIKSERKQQTEDRVRLLRIMLTTLGITTNQTIQKTPKLSTLYLLAYSDNVRTSTIELLKSVAVAGESGSAQIRGENDTFVLLTHASQRPSIAEDEAELDSPSFDEQIKYISLDRHPPEFPMFDPSKYFAILHRLHYASQSKGKSFEGPTFGTSLLYAETVTSSQSLLDKNFSLQKHLPSGFTILCSHQLTGRGRGQNAWVSPAGVLSFSTILHHKPDKSATTGSIVFIQYLVSLAVAEAIIMLRPSLGIRIKWPNDIYLQVPSSSPSLSNTFESRGIKYAKVSGSLITTSWHQERYIMTLGIGINVSNLQPSISLNSLLPPAQGISMEELFATVLICFSEIYQGFLAADCSFAPFEDRYYSLWLHSDQQVRIEATDEAGVVKGINLRDGTLKVATSSGKDIGLQADGNSFDMMKGLLKVKL